MKRILICGFIVIIMIILGTASFYYTDSVTESSSRAIDEISASFESGDLAKARGLTIQLNSDWQDFSQNCIFAVDRDRIADITASIVRIKALADKNGDELPVECETAKELIMIYRNETRVLLRNIF